MFYLWVAAEPSPALQGLLNQPHGSSVCARPPRMVPETVKATVKAPNRGVLPMTKDYDRIRELARRLIRSSALLPVALFVAVLWWSLGGAAKNTSLSAGTLVVDDRDLDIGAVWTQQALCRSLPIRNPTSEDNRVLEFGSSCSCLSVEPKSLLVPAGGTVTVLVTIDLTPKTTSEANSFARDFRMTLVPRIQNSQLLAGGWTIHGYVRSPITPSTQLIHFGDGLILGKPFPSQVIELTAHVPLGRLHADCPSSFATATVFPQKGSQSTKYRLTISPKENLPEGPFSFRLILTATDVTGTELPNMIFLVKGEVAPDVQAYPKMLLFGATPIGQPRIETILLRSSRGERFEVDAIQVDSDTVTAEPLRADPQLGLAFRITHLVTEPGQSVSRVTFAVRTGRGTTHWVVLESRCYGIRGGAIRAYPVNPL